MLGQARISIRVLLASVGLASLAAAAPAPTTPPAPAPPAPVWSVAFSPDGKTLAAGSYRQVQLWDLATKSVARTLTGHAGPVRSLAWSPDGKQLAAGGGRPGVQGEVRVWQLAGEASPGSAAEAVALQEHSDVVEGVAFAADPKVLLTASVDERALATDLASRKPVKTMGDHTNRVVAVAVSPNGRYVATGSLDSTVKIWSGKDFTPLANLDRNGGPVYAVAFLPPGDQLAAAGEDGIVRIYRLTESRTGSTAGVNGVMVRNFEGTRKPVLALATAPKGSLLASGGGDKTVTVVDAASGNRRYTLKECPDVVYSLAISPDGSTLAAGARDGKVRLWSLTDGKLIAEL